MKATGKEKKMRTREIEVTVVPTWIAFNEDPDAEHDVLFCEQDTEGLAIDDEIFFSGYTADQLRAMIGKNTGEDFTVLKVEEPYTETTHRVEAERAPEIR